MNYEEAYCLLEKTIGEEIKSLKTLINKGSNEDVTVTKAKIQVLYKIMNDFFKKAENKTK